MQSVVISKPFNKAMKRKDLQQKEVAINLRRSTSTINGYVKGEPAPVQVMADIAQSMDDSLLSQDFSYLVFQQFPSMDSDIYQDNAYSLEIIHQVESAERNRYKDQAMMALSKNKESLEKVDKDAIWNYAMNFLDEIFIEMRYVISLLDLLDMSLMQAIKSRRPMWVSKRYLRK